MKRRAYSLVAWAAVPLLGFTVSACGGGGGDDCVTSPDGYGCHVLPASSSSGGFSSSSGGWSSSSGGSSSGGQCPDVMCTLYCPFGFAAGADGCLVCSCLPGPACEDIVDENTCRLVDGCVPVFWDNGAPKMVAEDPANENFQCCTASADGSVRCRGTQDECALAWLDASGTCRSGNDGVAPAYCCQQDTCTSDADCGPGYACDIWSTCDSRCGSDPNERCAEVCMGRCVPWVDPCTRVDCGPGFACVSCPPNVICDVPYTCVPTGDCRQTGCGAGYECTEISTDCGYVGEDGARRPSDCYPGSTWQCMPSTMDCRTTGCQVGERCVEHLVNCATNEAGESGADPVTNCQGGSVWICEPGNYLDCRYTGCQAGTVCKNVATDYCTQPAVGEDGTSADPARPYCGEVWECVPADPDRCAMLDERQCLVSSSCQPVYITTCAAVDCADGSDCYVPPEECVTTFAGCQAVGPQDCRVTGCMPGTVCKNVGMDYCTQPAVGDDGNAGAPAYCGEVWQCVPEYPDHCATLDERQCLASSSCQPIYATICTAVDCADGADCLVPPEECMNTFVGCQAVGPQDCRVTGCMPGTVCKNVGMDYCTQPAVGDDGNAGAAPAYCGEVWQCVPEYPDHCAMLDERQCLASSSCQPIYATACNAGCQDDEPCAYPGGDCYSIFVGCQAVGPQDCRVTGCGPGMVCQETMVDPCAAGYLDCNEGSRVADSFTAWVCVPAQPDHCFMLDEQQCLSSSSCQPVYTTTCTAGACQDQAGCVAPPEQCVTTYAGCNSVTQWDCRITGCQMGERCVQVRDSEEWVCQPGNYLDCRYTGCQEGTVCKNVSNDYCGGSAQGDDPTSGSPVYCGEDWQCVPEVDPCAAVTCGPGTVCQVCGPNMDCLVQCVPDVCTDGAFRCDGNLVQACKERRWIDGPDCNAVGLVCADGMCRNP